jgi:hypothetical protein
MKFSSSLHKIINLIVSPRTKTSLRVASLARPGIFQYPRPMEPGISIVTLGVSDLNRSIIFCRDGLGLPTTFKEAENIAFFQLKGTLLVLYPSDALAEDACLPQQRVCFSGITLAHNGRS